MPTLPTVDIEFHGIVQSYTYSTIGKNLHGLRDDFIACTSKTTFIDIDNSISVLSSHSRGCACITILPITSQIVLQG